MEHISRFTRTALLFMLVTPLCGAAEYFGMELAKDSLSSVKSKLKRDGAIYNTNLGYRGDSRLPSIKVSTYDRLEQYGKLKYAWLFFNPKGLLYRLEVVWFDAGQGHEMLRDALDIKYEYQDNSGTGFTRVRRYRDKVVLIELHRFFVLISRQDLLHLLLGFALNSFQVSCDSNFLPQPRCKRFPACSQAIFMKLRMLPATTGISFFN